VEGTTEDEKSDVEFQPGATFSQQENKTVERAIREENSQEEMDVAAQEVESSIHAPLIQPGGVRKEIPRLEWGQVQIVRNRPVVPTVPQQKKKEVKKPEVVGTPKGPRAGGIKLEFKKPEIKKPEKTPEGKKKDMWVLRAAAPLPPKKHPGQAQQQQC
jgi:hypothetical protein